MGIATDGRGELARLRRLYHHVVNGGKLQPRDRYENKEQIAAAIVRLEEQENLLTKKD